MSAEETGLLGQAHLLAQLSCLCADWAEMGIMHIGALWVVVVCFKTDKNYHVTHTHTHTHTHTNKPPQVGLGKFEALQQELATRDFAKGCRYHLHAVRIVFVLHWTSVGYYDFSWARICGYTGIWCVCNSQGCCTECCCATTGIGCSFPIVDVTGPFWFAMNME